MIRSIFFKTMLLWVVAASLLLISPYARAETVLSEDESDWYMTIMPSDTAGEVHYLFFSRLKPGKSWSEIKTFNEVEGYDFDPAMLAIVGDEKIMGLAWVYPAPLDCELIPRPQAETDEKGELFGCITLFTVSTEGADLESFRSNLLTDPAAVMVFIAAENWADPLPEEDAIIILASAMLPQSSDSDDDYIPDAVDNCPEAANSEQLDSDADGVGDQCDTEEPSGASDDEDGDGVVDESDICPDTVSGQTVDANGCSEAQLAASGTVSTEGGLGPAAASGEGACSAVPAAPINPMAFLIISAALAAWLARRRK